MTSATSLVLPEGSVIGILGGGQLGRMTAIAAAELGYRCHVFAPEGDAPATDIAMTSTRAAYEDEDALAAFADSVDTITSEFENVPAETMEFLGQRRPVSPGAEALRVAQHRIAEKSLAAKLGIATPRFAAIARADQIAEPLADMPNGAILKTCRFGYDGKGQMPVMAAGEADQAFDALRSDDCILEERIDFIAEVSFLIARTENGETALFPPSLNTHKAGILDTSTAPADRDIVSLALVREGGEAALALADHLALTGLLAVEMFVKDNRLIFNEMAPRPHNSFHWTIEGAETSQFAQLVRAITGLPLGSTKATGVWQMENILGQDMEKLDLAMGQPGAYIHRYGKAAARPGRKMAHITRQLS
ncbi:5-(carboxyamino)imidazole ribonucleotide synthase [Alphaproteobacteria bacterium LSUCC0684]